MAIKGSVGGGADFEKVPAGVHPAVCNLIADVGLQPGSGQFPDPKYKIYLRFEVPGERVSYTKDGVEKEGPATIYCNFNLSMNNKATLRKRLESWRGRKFTDQEAEQFDIGRVLGKACLIQVTHTDDGKYANVDNIMALPKGTPVLKAENPLILFGREDDGSYEQLPKFLKEKWDNQLDPGRAQPKPQKGQTAADIEADRIAEQQAAKRAQTVPADDFEDDIIPF